MTKIPVQWICHECGDHNEDDYNSTVVVVCDSCGFRVNWEDVLTEDQLLAAESEAERIADLPNLESWWQVTASINVIVIVTATSREEAERKVRDLEYIDFEIEDEPIHALDIEVHEVEPHTHQPEEDDEEDFD
jgi:DNA-directed RNA polymerase subunit RPC12/RpoP